MPRSQGCLGMGSPHTHAPQASRPLPTRRSSWQPRRAQLGTPPRATSLRAGSQVPAHWAWPRPQPVGPLCIPSTGFSARSSASPSLPSPLTPHAVTSAPVLSWPPKLISPLAATPRGAACRPACRPSPLLHCCLAVRAPARVPLPCCSAFSPTPWNLHPDSLSPVTSKEPGPCHAEICPHPCPESAHPCQFVSWGSPG